MKFEIWEIPKGLIESVLPIRLGICHPHYLRYICSIYPNIRKYYNFFSLKWQETSKIYLNLASRLLSGILAIIINTFIWKPVKIDIKSQKYSGIERWDLGGSETLGNRRGRITEWIFEDLKWLLLYITSDIL